MAEVRLARRAVKDLDSISKTQTRRILDSLDRLAKDPERPELDVKPLVGRRPWRRLRVGDYRVLLRIDPSTMLVARVVHRRDLDRAFRTLPD